MNRNKEPSVPFGRHDDESSNSQVEEEGTSANGIEDNPEDESQGTYDVEDGDSGQEDEVLCLLFHGIPNNLFFVLLCMFTLLSDTS